MKIGQKVELLNGKAFKGYHGAIDYIAKDGSFHIKGETSVLSCPIVKGKPRVVVRELGLMSSPFNKQCYVCKMYPFDIRFDSSYLWPIYHCPECELEKAVNGWFKKILYKIGLLG
jgi:hypothetical protein